MTFHQSLPDDDETQDYEVAVAMLKLYAFRGAETDWVAASDEASARDFLKRHYGINDDDIASSYECVDEWGRRDRNGRDAR